LLREPAVKDGAGLGEDVLVRLTTNGAEGSRGEMPSLEAAAIRYWYVCATHGVVGSVAVRRVVPPRPRRCSTCRASGEIWVGASPPAPKPGTDAVRGRPYLHVAGF